MNIFQQVLIQNLRKSDKPEVKLTTEEKREMRTLQNADKQKSVKRPVVYKSGPGGVLFDFGSDSSRVTDSFNALLSTTADPVQAQIARDQRNAMQKSLERYVDVGEHKYEDEMRNKGVDTKQMSKSTDDIIKEMHSRGELSVDDSGPGVFIKGEFNKSKMKLGGEEIVGQSETDAAVIEMMKGLQHLEEEETNGIY